MTGNEVLAAWETGLRQEPAARALTMLAAALPDRTWAELAGLPLGRRDALLLELFAGASLEACAVCPACGERLEYSLDPLVLRGTSSGDPMAFLCDGVEVRFRLLTTADVLVATADGVADPAAVRVRLARRCLACAPDELSEPLLEQLSARLAECDPLAEVLLDMRCPACGRTWQEQFDIADYLWTEVSRHARQLLREVHLLAAAYGWSEAAILALSETRRQYYLELVDR